MKREYTIARNYMYHVYYHDDRFYVDFYKHDMPIHSYASIESVKEMLYYAGLIDSKSADV